MRLMQAGLVPLMLAAVGLYALYKGVDVFPTFLRGAKSGLQTAVSILPTMVGMLTVVYMLRASGAIDIAAAALAPVLNLFGIPQECAALTLLKPISGGGGLALGSEIMQRCGPDSYAGRVAAVMLGSSETSLYTISVYSGHLGLSKMRYMVFAALCADLTAFAVSAAMVRVMFPYK
ncbi:spore maturation protein [Agathobaculum sp. NTUH-O15-33]|uniref:nucleoside recognition domain-containing protein n=1 Tax=Butyricicoccaceae TaxID=3085642 RepID=UPI002958A857|nr:nucleoside recognition domain-containing protein [Agathobaculum sp. NTUH-O15-33]WNX85842.1 spore maturation protein [Agathobaculum sp. NTUH-O15-33]